MAASTLLASDLQIEINPRVFTEYQGTAAQLIAEGLIPDGFKWPIRSVRVTIEVGKFSLRIGRQRPKGHKGPMKSWASGDCWFVRRELAAPVGDIWCDAEIYVKTKELKSVIYRGTREFARTANASWRAHCDDEYQAFRRLVFPEPKRGPGRPAKARAQAHGAST
jgi:hypothetical protein